MLGLSIMLLLCDYNFPALAFNLSKREKYQKAGEN
jgi:hypothetical protein